MARIAAELLDAPWCDLDARIEARTGQGVAAIFAEQGEAAFRRLEREAMAEALGAPQIVAAGGGWAAHPGNLALAESHALTLYLCVAPETAAQRLGQAGDRPLLSGDPLPRLREQLARREAWYLQADLEIDGNRPADQVASEVAAVARQYAGW